MTNLISRRQMLSVALAASGALTAGVLAAAETGTGGAGAAPTGSPTGTSPAKVDAKDATAVALGYVSDAKRVDKAASPTFQAGASCSSCSWYQGKPADPAGGPCTFFPGKNVDANGWCRMWSKKQ